jgi:hypothetical protein
MNAEFHDKLRKIIAKRFERLLDENLEALANFYGISAAERKELDLAWNDVCGRLEIKRDQNSPAGECVLDELELVVAADPHPDGIWLEMNKETALMILALGMP